MNSRFSFLKKLLITELESESFQNDLRFKSDVEFFKKVKCYLNLKRIKSHLFYLILY